ncbi:hypothetical protein DH2020_045080 [Rehmannia glutinosa]|uniref:NIF system FeS cluster assembly NifU C-terminal domain-containing protein n=1 Tax=Rehmannia glutinosa TaxID=99300 RepID=A0ABR0UF60_REHGL
MNAAMAVSSSPYAYSCRFNQTLDPSCSPSSAAAALSRRSSSPKVSSFFGARIYLSGRLNKVRVGVASSQRMLYGLRSNSRQRGIKAVVTPDSTVELPLTAENVESVLDEIRPYLISDGVISTMTMKMGIERRLMEKIPEVVAVESIPDEETGLELNGENIEKHVYVAKRFRTSFYGVRDTLVTKNSVSSFSVSSIFRAYMRSAIYTALTQYVCAQEIRPYLVGAAGGDLELIEIEEPIVKVRISGPAAGVMTVRVAVTQKLREKFHPLQQFNFCHEYYLKITLYAKYVAHAPKMESFSVLNIVQ